MKSEIPKNEPARSRFIARAETFAVAYRAGALLEDIGKQHGISRERVRQHLAAIGVSGQDGGGRVVALANAEARKRSKDTLYLRRHGVTKDEYLSVPGSARRAFSRQKVNAKMRGIAWELTITQWWKIWQDSGKWAQRGRGRGYCMGRNGDAGPYAAGNVYICTSSENISHSYIFKPCSERRFSTKYTKELGMTLSEAARKAGLLPRTVRLRVGVLGWTLKEALETPVKPTHTHLKRMADSAA